MRHWMVRFQFHVCTQDITTGWSVVGHECGTLRHRFVRQPCESLAHISHKQLTIKSLKHLTVESAKRFLVDMYPSNCPITVIDIRELSQADAVQNFRDGTMIPDK
jgi:hypothetical protein